MLITTHQDNVWTIKLQMKYIQNSKPLHFNRESTGGGGKAGSVVGGITGAGMGALVSGAISPNDMCPLG